MVIITVIGYAKNNGIYVYITYLVVISVIVTLKKKKKQINKYKLKKIKNLIRSILPLMLTKTVPTPTRLSLLSVDQAKPSPSPSAFSPASRTMNVICSPGEMLAVFEYRTQVTPSFVRVAVLSSLLVEYPSVLSDHSACN